MTDLEHDRFRWLRHALRANAGFSALSALALVAGSAALARRFGVANPLWLTLLGWNLAAFATALVWLASRSPIPLGAARIVVALDLAWVLASGVVLATGPLTAAGHWAVAIVADAVLVLAIAQAVGIRRAQRALDPTALRTA